MPRKRSAVATLTSVGVFIIGGTGANNVRTSDFLAAGQMQWQEGPALPVNMRSGPCAITITPTSFITILGTNIREFDAAIAGPTSIAGWREAGRWPRLETSRNSWPGCVKLGRKVIIAGGYYSGKNFRSTEVLDLDSREITAGGDMATPRRWLHLATIRRGGLERVVALAGRGESTQVNTVEEWVEESATWKAANSLSQAKSSFGTVAIPVELICPA